ncbi:MAG: hypothetical protein JXA93_24480 [Anaerolineae bacterium]|nr:hypothetical protein [Anaerolineae bacterium]
MTKVTISFTLDSERDRRILRHLESLPRGEKSAAIRQALDLQMGGGGMTLGDIYQAIKDLERKVANRPVVVQANGADSEFQTPVDEPVDVAANLDSLGL